MATSAEELSNRLNVRFHAFDENPLVTASEFIPLRSTVTALSLAGDSTRTTASAAAAESARLRTSMDVAKESRRRLWALSDDGVSKSSHGAGIHVIGANSGGGIAGGGSEFKPFFRQKFDPKESSIAAFITVYKAAMRRATDEKKKDYILNCLGPTAQEVIVPELPSIQTWAQMRTLLIAEFGGELSLEVKKGRVYAHGFQAQGNPRRIRQWFLFQRPT